jgi:nitrite reductase/ring-hydroxylating ferredoxin subunit
VAFRATDGRVGFFDEACPHRGVSLALGRNEDCAIRCIFHGWKIDVSGQVVEVPSEPAGSNMASKIKVNHYPVQEAAGLIWVWLGQGEVPAFPDYEFNRVPLENLKIIQAKTHTSWLQIMETTIDSSHVGILHQNWLKYMAGESRDDVSMRLRQDLSPVYEIEHTDYGFHAAAVRTMADKTLYVRVSQYIAPFISFIPVADETPKFTNIVVPIDDEHSIHWFVYHNADKPMNQDPSFFETRFGTNEPDLDNFYDNKGGVDNMWGQDREAMKNGHFTGVYALFAEDFVIGESQGAIFDRSKEKLGRSDTAIINARKVLLKAVQDYQNGKPAFGQGPSISFQHVDAKNLVLEAGDNWRKYLDTPVKQSVGAV